MEEISFDLISKMHDHITRTEKQSILLEDLDKWCRVTAALDVLEDATGAVNYYCQTPYPQNVNGKYLFTYGLLQAFSMLEDAINSISISLFDKNINFSNEFPDAFSVREIRNDILHSTQRGKENYIHLAQMSLTKDSFYYIKECSKDGSYNIVDVNVCSAINDVAKCINSILASADERLHAEFIEYIEKHRDRKMIEIFDRLYYAKEKALFEANTSIGQWGYETTKEMVSHFENELTVRYGSPEALDTYKFVLADIHELYSLIDGRIQTLPADLLLPIKKNLLENLFNKLEWLKDGCREIDDYFENYGERPPALDDEDDL